MEGHRLRQAPKEKSPGIAAGAFLYQIDLDRVSASGSPLSYEKKMIKIPDQITGSWLNSLSVEDRKVVLAGPFSQRMHAWAGSHVTFIRWATGMMFGTRINNGSIFFLDIGGKLFAVTARHVYDAYMLAKKNYKRVICHVGNLEFNPERRLVGYDSSIDIVTFDFTYDELATTGKQAIVVASGTWPPPHPMSGQAALLAGFPAASRLWINRRAISFGLYVASPMINSVSDAQVTCPLERDFWIEATGRHLPPRGFDLGGASGGPLFLPMDKDGLWDLYLGGVISEAKASMDYETVVCVPAHFIAADGSINRRSVPIKHVVPSA